MVAVTGTPSINIYRQFALDGGTGYFTREDEAANQLLRTYVGDVLVADYGAKLATLSPGETFTLPMKYAGGLLFDRLLFEGVGAGTGVR